MKKLVRSRSNRMLAGVIGGLADSIGMDAKLLRIIFVLLMFLTAFFPFVLLYAVLVFTLPNELDV